MAGLEFTLVDLGTQDSRQLLVQRLGTPEIDHDTMVSPVLPAQAVYPVQSMDRVYRLAYGAGMAQPVGGSHPALDAAGDERPASLVPTHLADIAEDAARHAVEGIGIPRRHPCRTYRGWPLR